MIPDKKKVLIDGKFITTTLEFRIDVPKVVVTEYIPFKDEYLKISKMLIYEVDKETRVFYFYVPDQSIIGIKGMLQLARLKKKYRQYSI